MIRYRRSVQKASSYMKNRDIYWRRCKIQKTLYIAQWCLSLLQSRHLGPHTFSQLPSAALLYFSESHQQFEISSISKVVLFWGKARSHRAPLLGYRDAQSPWWFDICKKNCTRRDAWAGMLLWWNCQSPVAHSCRFLNHPNSFCGGMFELHAKFDVDSLLCSLILNVIATQYFVLTQGYLLHPLTSTVKSPSFTHAYPSPLSFAARLHWCHTNCSHYINNVWTFSRQT